MLKVPKFRVPLSKVRAIVDSTTESREQKYCTKAKSKHIHFDDDGNIIEKNQLDGDDECENGEDQVDYDELVDYEDSNMKVEEEKDLITACNKSDDVVHDSLNNKQHHNDNKVYGENWCEYQEEAPIHEYTPLCEDMEDGRGRKKRLQAPQKTVDLRNLWIEEVEVTAYV